MDSYEKAQQYIDNKVDVINYLSFTKEYNYLKSLIFNDMQCICLNYSKSPKLYENSRFSKLNKDDKEMIEKIVKFYMYNQKLTEQERNLFELLSDDIKDLITRYKPSK